MVSFHQAADTNLQRHDDGRYALQVICGGTLPGPVQTINRAELQALLTVAKSTTHGFTYVTDSTYVRSGMEKLQAGAMDCITTNADMWYAMGQALQGRAVKVLWRESHQKVEEVRSLQEWIHFLGNEAADEVAGEIAAQIAVTSKAAEDIRKLEDLARNIQDRRGQNTRRMFESRPVREEKGRTQNATTCTRRPDRAYHCLVRDAAQVCRVPEHQSTVPSKTQSEGMAADPLHPTT